jgi:ABC-2 type transport system permease protein
MNTMKWLLRREFWENKGSMFWAPAIISLIMLVFIGGSILYIAGSNNVNSNITIGHQHLGSAAAMAAIPAEARARMGEDFASGYIGAAMPLFGVMAFVIFFYCLAALYDERRDRSILFWKSLPISDEKTVLSKVVAALCLAPLITIALAVLTSLGLVLIACIGLRMNGLNMFGTIFTSPQLYLSPLYLLALWPVYVVWALPTVGWLLMVSAWARSKVFLWAVGVPALAIGLVKWVTFLLGDLGGGFSSAVWFSKNVVARALLGLFPGNWFGYVDGLSQHTGAAADQGINLNAIVSNSYASLATPDALIGAFVGAAMIYAAIRLRRWREEG